MGIPIALLPFSTMALLLPTIPHHWQMRPDSFATLSMIAWLMLTNLIEGVNAAIWENEVDPAPKGLAVNVWCDIGTKLIIGASAGMPGSCLCLARRLYRIISGNDIGERKRKDWIFDITLCWMMPVLVMGLHIIVQGHRFDLVLHFGCTPTIYFSWPSLIIINLPIALCGVFSTIYSAFTLRTLYARHRLARMRIHYHSTVTATTIANKQPPQPTTSFMTFVRLLAVTFLLGTLTTASIIFQLYSDFHGIGLEPWTSWAYVHWGFGAIYTFESADFTTLGVVSQWLLWLAWPLGGIVFFLLFGLGKDVRREWIERWTTIKAWYKGVHRPRTPLPIKDIQQDDSSHTRFSEVIIIGPGLGLDGFENPGPRAESSQSFTTCTENTAV
ncbi:Short-chain dehydrogenase/reductase family protein [Mycena chlorophos]|uniref:Short-chain dehydrogenase/reductase family protein n=1 Tax=Mycena chlorophos TaxID=658473 RepID=A0A8H6TK35_MYCCL|nr:Short-chain dehydrogenase/reductase family protein [Mycena chlorophos]